MKSGDKLYVNNLTAADFFMTGKMSFNNYVALGDNNYQFSPSDFIKQALNCCFMLSDNSKSRIRNVLLLLIRLWLGYAMIMGGQSVLTVFTADKAFFIKWFGHDLGFPFPLFMAFLAKGTEFAGGILLCFGLFTRVSSSLIALVMLVATLVANIDYHIKEHLLKEDAFQTISCFLFASLIVQLGAGSYSLDSLLFKTRFKLI